MKSDSEQIIILENWESLLAVFKPSGWLTIPGRGHKENIPVLSGRLGSQLRGGDARGDKPDLYTIHRLDEGTSGVVLFARTPQTHSEVSRLFENHLVKKTYWCIVKGKPTNQVIDAPLFKLPSKKNKSVIDVKGKAAQTIIKTLSTQGEYSLVEAIPLTGRSHQIRVHLAHIACPLIGDTLYGGPGEVLGQRCVYPLLHAHSLDFEWPQGTKRHVSAPAEGLFDQAQRTLKA